MTTSRCLLYVLFNFIFISSISGNVKGFLSTKLKWEKQNKFLENSNVSLNAVKYINKCDNKPRCLHYWEIIGFKAHRLQVEHHASGIITF